MGEAYPFKMGIFVIETKPVVRAFFIFPKSPATRIIYKSKKGVLELVQRNLKNKQKNVFICNENIFDLPISVYAKMVYIYLCSCAGVANEFLLANNTITQKCSLSKNKIQKAIKELVEIGLLSEKKSQAGNSTTKFLELQLL